jgi:hypothetical protein
MLVIFSTDQISRVDGQPYRILSVGLAEHENKHARSETIVLSIFDVALRQESRKYVENNDSASLPISN